MMNRILTSTLRLLLAVLISTFMSPSFAWQMIDGHHETTIASAIGNDDHYHQENDLHHHHHHDHDGEGDDDTSHNQIGHLLSHLPVVMQQIKSLPVSPADSSPFPVCKRTFACAAKYPPFKPPRSFLVV